MKKSLIQIFLAGFCVLFAWFLTGVTIPAHALAETLPAVRIAGPINPVISQFVVDQLQIADQQDAPAFLVEIDTPGGLDTAMRKIIQAVFASDIPVVVYVSPAGARAASAGALIALSADFVGLAPGTNIGAATPVSIGMGGSGQSDEMKTKVLNDAIAYARSLADQRGRNREWAEQIVREGASTTAEDALTLKVIDVIATDRTELLEKLDGRRYLRRGEARQLAVRDAEPIFVEMNWRQQILDAISNPNVAYLLMMLGLLGVFFEISQPGVILPGVVGAIAILLALFAFQSLPVNYVGVLLILLALVLFVLEVKVTSYGMLTVGGIVALSLGSLMLIDTSVPYLQLSRAIILATVVTCSGFFVFCLYFVIRVQRGRFISGREAMAGEIGRAVTPVNRSGRVFVHGEYWDAVAEEPVQEGQAIEVIEVGPQMRLRVRPLTDHD
ncbi:MAG: nodulation protein NfeD [Desulfuromonadales bacterium]